MSDRAYDRTYDLVLLGATGFTGGLTAEYLSRHAPEGVRWAIAGRNLDRLSAVLDRLEGSAPDAIRVDAGDAEALRAVAEDTRVLVTTVGPYAVHGEPVVAACASAGTDYLDLTGEPEFVDRMWLRHHETAVRSGARLVHACGFDSVPHDLGALFTVQQLPEDVPLTVRGYVRAGGSISGGTFHSALRAFGRVRQSASAARSRRDAEPRPSGRRVRADSRPRRGPGGRGWAVPLPTIDPVIVRRSARALERYGPDFTYGHFALVRRLPTLVAGGIGLGAVFAIAQLPPGRDLLLRLREPGEGPDRDQRQESWFRVRFVGEGGGRQVVTEVRGGDPGYGETAKMLAESALCISLDDLPPTAGQVTTAQAMGEALQRRLVAAGITFTTLDQP